MYMSAYVSHDSDVLELKNNPIKKASSKKSKWDMNLKFASESGYQLLTNSLDDCESWSGKRKPKDCNVTLDSKLQSQRHFSESNKENSFSDDATQCESVKGSGNCLTKKMLKAKRTLKNCFKPSSSYQSNVE